jgi:peptidoglycan/xylan/chitin deacetylase (PgdA/CDA1 family)
VLTYHSQHIAGSTYPENDHIALAADLELINDSGLRIVPLHWLISLLNGERGDQDLHGAVCLTFDDGCDFDVRDIEFPGHGLQRSFLGIMEDFLSGAGAAAQPHLHATSFVIASSEARGILDASQLSGRGWISHDWWRAAEQHPMLAIENHGWDHNHPDLPGSGRGGFNQVDTFEHCLEQVVRAGASIEVESGRWPCLFAYPFGESSAYIRESFFPGQPNVHGCSAALGTAPAKVSRDSDRWNLPRYVCGRDWRSTEELADLILQK